jgi:hypothetical protein
MMGLDGRASGGPPAPPQGGWVGKKDYVWFRQGKPMIWQVFYCLPSQGNCRASLRYQPIRGKDDPVSEFTILRHLTRRPK